MKKLISAILIIATLVMLAIPALAVSAANSDPLAYDIETELRWMGRTYSKQDKHFFNWSSSGFEFCFKGSGATAEIYSNAPGGKHTAYIKIYIDGVEQPDVALEKTSQTIVLAKDLDPNAEHTVKVLKRTNARSSAAALVSLRLHDGEKLAPTVNSTRYIEFVGDSLTVGYSTIANGQTTWSTATEDSTKTYVDQISNAFFADHSIVAISGRGVVLNVDGDTDKLLSTIYDYVDEYNNPSVKYDFARQPDVIVINLGENDAANGNLSSEDFQAGLKKFLLNVRAKNPKAEIIYVYGLTARKFCGDMEIVINQLRAEGDEHIYFSELKRCSGRECVINHPTAKAYVSRGETIIDLIAQATGWTPHDKSEVETLPPPETTPAETTPAETTPAETTPTDTTPTTPDVTEPVNNGGCGSALLPMTLLGTLAASCVALSRKKKKNR